MDVMWMFDKNSCNISGKFGSDIWSWEEYFEYKKKYWDKIVLVDMIWQPIENSVPISNEMFFNKKYPDWTIFALYCHSGGSSGYVQKQLKNVLTQYKFINIAGGIWSYMLYRL